MVLTKKHYIYFTILIFFATYLVFANHIFNKWIIVSGEARIVDFKLPPSTSNIHYGIDEIKEQNIKWKEALQIKGWAFKDHLNKEQRDTYIVLQSEGEQLFFKTDHANITRTDISAHFNLDGDIHSHGFEFFIPKYRIKDGMYRLGIIIEDELGTSFTLMDKYISKNGGILAEENINYLSIQKAIEIEEETTEVKYNIEGVDLGDSYLNIRGWAFLEGLDIDNTETYIILKRDEHIKIFNTESQIRPDVSKHFKVDGLNKDLSGFLAGIPIVALEEGVYEIGLYIIQDDHRGIVYYEELMEIPGT